MRGRICIHESTGQPCILLRVYKLLETLRFDVLVPTHDERGELLFSNASYTSEEVLVTDEFLE